MGTSLGLATPLVTECINGCLAFRIPCNWTLSSLPADYPQRHLRRLRSAKRGTYRQDVRSYLSFLMLGWVFIVSGAASS